MTQVLGFTSHILDDCNLLVLGTLPDDLWPDPEFVEALWQLHPLEYHQIKIRGQWVKTPRWEQAYECSYDYVGNTNEALALPSQLRPYWSWVRHSVDERLNGLLLNWYDGDLQHYIGKHRDKIKPLIEGAPIVTVCFGATRTLRLRPYRGSGFTDFSLTHGTVVVLPYETNRSWTHEVPHFAGDVGRRISLTIRAFMHDS